jgi:hypothetical protein
MKPIPIVAPSPPEIGLNLGVTGHRSANASFAQNKGPIEAVLAHVLEVIAQAIVKYQPDAQARTRLHALMVDGLDQIAAEQARSRGWQIVAPLPFGNALNTAINAQPQTSAEARALLTGEGACSTETLVRARAIRSTTEAAHVFALADQDQEIARLFVEKLDAPHDERKAQAYAFASSQRVALAARVMIEQSDFLVGVWDGASTSFIGGTGHTIALALSLGAPVIWIDARAPEGWTLLHTPEALATLTQAPDRSATRDQDLAQLVHDALVLSPGKLSKALHDGHASGHRKHQSRETLPGQNALDLEHWQAKSQAVFHGYRRIEALFGADTWKERLKNLTQTYETPDGILESSAKPQLAALSALTRSDPAFSTRIKEHIWKRFAWADGHSARLSDSYRGGMILNFVFSAFAIVGGIAYLPFSSPDQKWMFAIFELVLLSGILAITFVGQKRRWHGRWFETRRVAEYLRHAPILLSLGVLRPVGRWPRGKNTSWPEWYARHGWRNVGLPQVEVNQAFLRSALADLLKPHVIGQRDYHLQKARRLAQVHHRLDKCSEVLFFLAVVSVSIYLTLKLGSTLHVFDKSFVSGSSKLLTFLGVLLPTFGGAIAGIRFFGDFERFSAISDVTAEKLDTIATRIEVLLSAPDIALDYGRVTELANAADDVVVSEIENWQAVFGGKPITVPV